MKKCPSCQHEHKNEEAFCVSCGTALKNNARSTAKVSQARSNGQAANAKKKKVMLPVIILVLALGLFTSYQLLAKKYQAENVSEQFLTALEKEDRTSLKELIHPDDGRLKLNDASLDALFTLLEEKPSLMQEIASDLDLNYPHGHFYLEKEGKVLGIFNQYVIGTKGHFLSLSDSSQGETTFYLNDEEIGSLDQDDPSKEFGPYLVGSYQVKAVNDSNDQPNEVEEKISLDRADHKESINFDTGADLEDTALGSDDLDELEDSDDQYLLPNSDKEFLKKEDIEHLSVSELRLARNEIFARHGYIFDSDDLQDYFDQMDWYYPNSAYMGSLTSIEEENVELIKSFE